MRRARCHGWRWDIVAGFDRQPLIIPANPIARFGHRPALHVSLDWVIDKYRQHMTGRDTHEQETSHDSFPPAAPAGAASPGRRGHGGPAALGPGQRLPQPMYSALI
eukprot:Opistho-2@9578